MRFADKLNLKTCHRGLTLAGAMLCLSACVSENAGNFSVTASGQCTGSFERAYSAVIRAHEKVNALNGENSNSKEATTELQQACSDFFAVHANRSCRSSVLKSTVAQASSEDLEKNCAKPGVTTPKSLKTEPPKTYDLKAAKERLDSALSGLQISIFANSSHKLKGVVQDPEILNRLLESSRERQLQTAEQKGIVKGIVVSLGTELSSDATYCSLSAVSSDRTSLPVVQLSKDQTIEVESHTETLDRKSSFATLYVSSPTGQIGVLKIVCKKPQRTPFRIGHLKEAFGPSITWSL